MPDVEYVSYEIILGTLMIFEELNIVIRLAMSVGQSRKSVFHWEPPEMNSERALS